MSGTQRVAVRSLARITILAALAAMIPAGATGQDVSSQVGSAPDGWVRLTYPAKEGVCGDGRSISLEGGERRSGTRGFCDCTCEEGPVRLELRVRQGEVREIDVEVGGSWKSRSGTVTDLGEVPPSEAIDFLFGVAASADEDVAEDAVFPATIARGVEVWPRLLELARGDAPTEVRKQAVFWLGVEAGEQATEGLTSIIEDADELEVREHAIFALSQREEAVAVDALMRVARTSPEPELRRKAIFWLGQRGDDPRVLQLLEEILGGGG